MAYGFGPIEGPPTLAQGHGPQITAGLASFNAAVAAMMARPRPRRIDANIFEAYVCLLETGAVSTLIEGGVMARLGVNRMVPVYPAASYRTADGWSTAATSFRCARRWPTTAWRTCCRSWRSTAAATSTRVSPATRSAALRR